MSLINKVTEWWEIIKGSYLIYIGFFTLIGAMYFIFPDKAIIKNLPFPKDFEFLGRLDYVTYAILGLIVIAGYPFGQLHIANPL